MEFFEPNQKVDDWIKEVSELGVADPNLVFEFEQFKPEEVVIDKFGVWRAKVKNKQKTQKESKIPEMEMRFQSKGFYMCFHQNVNQM